MSNSATEATTRPGLEMDGPPVRRIAVLRALFLGDVLCATPALRALYHRFPEAEITLIGLPWAAELVDRLPYLHRLDPFPGYPGLPEVAVDPEPTAAWLAAARTTPFDLAIQMHGSGQISNGFVSDLGARLTLGYRSGRDDRLTAALPWVEEEHEVRRWLRLVALLGASDESTTIDWPVTLHEQERAASLLAGLWDGPLIGLHAGAKDQARRWPPERFAALGDLLAERFGARIVLTGAASERAITGAVQAAMRAPVLNLTGETDLGVFAAVIAQLDLLVTNDTGASHLAAATGTRSVVLFGPSNPDQWAPLDRERHTVLDARALTGAPDPSRALAALPVEVVLRACADAFDTTGSALLQVGQARLDHRREGVCAR